MMYKNIKDEFIKNRNHQSVFVMQQKCDQDANQIEESIDEEKLIKQLIQKKMREREEKKESSTTLNTVKQESDTITMKES